MIEEISNDAQDADRQRNRIRPWLLLRGRGDNGIVLRFQLDQPSVVRHILIPLESKGNIVVALKFSIVVPQKIGTASANFLPIDFLACMQLLAKIQVLLGGLLFLCGRYFNRACFQHMTLLYTKLLV